MKLVTFSITNFRSITNAHKLNLSNISTLVGKNNEGKSNILKALNISMNILKNHGKRKTSYSTSRGMTSSRRNDENNYCWERDFPIQLRSSRSSQYTIFKLEFEFSSNETIEFKDVVGSSINGSLTIELAIGQGDNPDIVIKKSGKGTKETWAGKSDKITDYIAKRINITYIPAVRTEDHAISIVEEMIAYELSKIESNDEYIQAMDSINKLQKPILQKISDKIEKSLQQFIPDIKTVETKIIEYSRRLSLRRDCEILIDDGNKTNIEFKGDGVKSLVALSLLKDGYSGTGFSLIAIEEPESHLHSGAIHSLRDSIYDLGNGNQVIITTHNPLFVNADDIKSNIIVNGGNAKPAKNISEIREILGVRVSDNLTSARFILIVEGIEDEIALKYLFNYYSPNIKKAIGNKSLVIDNLGGASKLSYKLALYKTQLCKYHVLLDGDKAGENSYNKANQEGLLEPLNTTIVKAKGKKESEFEDLLNPVIYRDKILKKYGVNIDCDDFNKSHDKWSIRIKSVFDNNGKPFSQDIENEIKSLVADSIGGKELASLSEHNKNIFESLLESVEKLISD